MARPSLIEIVFEDRFDRGVGARPDLERAIAGDLHPLMSITLGQADDANRRSKALLGMRSFSQDDLDQGRRARSNLARAPLELLRRPVSEPPMARRHMLAHRGVPAVR